MIEMVFLFFFQRTTQVIFEILECTGELFTLKLEIRDRETMVEWKCNSV